MAKSKFNILGALALSGLMATPVSAQFVVRGSNGSAEALQPLTMTQSQARGLYTSSAIRTDYVASTNQYFVVAFNRIPSAAAQQRIATVSTYVSYLPENTYIYKASNAEKALEQVVKYAQEDGLTIEGSGALPLQFKLSEGLYKAFTSKTELSADIQTKGLEVSVFENGDLVALQQTLSEWGFTYTPATSNMLVVTSGVSLALVEQLAAIPYVNHVSPVMTPQQEMVHINYIMRTNSPHLINYDRKGPIGRGVYFINWEVYGAEDFFPIVSYGRNLTGALADNSTNDHGSNCGNIAIGANNIEEWEGGGMAPGATLIAGGNSSKTYHQVNGIGRAVADGYKPIVSNHSVGWSYGTTDYWPQAATIDRVTLESNAYLCCYSAGNRADSTLAPFTVKGYGSYSGGIKSNKNGFNVHSVGLPTVDVEWASFGPSKDGRMNPQICAEGTGGTSFASPGVAGLATLLMEQYKETYQTMARADVVKAVMMNTAIPVRTFIDKATNQRVDAVNHINYRTGFGQINPTAAVAAIKEKRVKFGEKVAQGQDIVVELDVPENQAELRFMLYWNDVPATTGAAKALINDLDIEVESPDGQTYLPWTLDPSPENVTKPPVRKADHLNNAEQVVIRAASKNQLLKGGKYKVHIKGYSIPNAAQQPEYVLTWQFRPRGIIMTSLPEGYRVNQGDDLMITWDMTLAEDEDKTALNVDQSWTSVNPGKMTPFVKFRNSANGNWLTVPRVKGKYGKNFFIYTVPTSMQTSDLQFQITADDLTATTNKVMVEPRLKERPTIVSFSPEKVKLSWTPATKTTEGKYYIHALFDKYMTIVDSVDMPITEKEVAAPTGRTWNPDNLFAISVRNSKTNAMSQRSQPAGLDQTNEFVVNSGNLWEDTYDLCGITTQTLKTNGLAGDVRWYKVINGVHNAIPNEDGGNLNARTFAREDYGQYYYTISETGTNNVIYTSKPVYFNRPAVEQSDTAFYGDGVWNGYVFYNMTGNYMSEPLLPANASLYGKFTLNKLSFNSNDDLFPWEKTTEGMSAYSGYIGCDVPGNSNYQVVVLKRKKFKPGEYTFTIKRGSMRAQLIFRDRLGAIIKSYTAPVNANNNAEVVRVTLDENSTCEIRWIGDHLNLEVIPPSFVAPTFAGYEEGQYYRITSAYSGFYNTQSVTKGMYMDNATNRTRWTTTDKTDVSQMWKLTANTEWPTVAVQNANTALYLKSGAMAGQTEASIITFNDLGSSQFGINGNNFNYVALKTTDSDEAGATTQAKTPPTINSIFAWYLEKANTIQLRVGDTGYASAYYPFAITVPSLQHFAVYTVGGLDADGRTLKGDLIPAGTTIPAGTPIVIGALPGAYEFPIEAANTAAAGTSAIGGMNAMATRFPDGAYVLGFDPARGVGYVPVGSPYAVAGAIGSNRTFYIAPASAGDFVPLNLSPVTGIDGVNANANGNDKNIYDASGRRLKTTPQRGFYINNGQKIYK